MYAAKAETSVPPVEYPAALAQDEVIPGGDGADLAQMVGAALGVDRMHVAQRAEDTHQHHGREVEPEGHPRERGGIAGEPGGEQQVEPEGRETAGEAGPAAERGPANRRSATAARQP